MYKSEFPDKEQILSAYSRIKPYIHKTPLLSSTHINSLTKASVFFKCQNLQKTGSFKLRGSFNKILQLQGVSKLCAHSSGNHGQAVAYVGQTLKIPTKIVMPYDTPEVKKNAVRDYGAEIVQSGTTAKDQEQLSSKVARQENATFIHPYNDFKVVAGAASVFYEACQEIKDFDYVVFPIGGGGLASGTLLSILHFSPKTKAVGVEPYLARDTYLSIKKGEIVPQLPPVTLGEGVRTGIGDVTFSVMKEFLSEIILVSQEEMVSAAQMFVERMKILVEFSGSIVLAALLKDKRFEGKKVCAIISGGNIDMGSFFLKTKENLKGKL